MNANQDEHSIQPSYYNVTDAEKSMIFYAISFTLNGFCVMIKRLFLLNFMIFDYDQYSF